MRMKRARWIWLAWRRRAARFSMILCEPSCFGPCSVLATGAQRALGPLVAGWGIEAEWPPCAAPDAVVVLMVAAHVITTPDPARAHRSARRVAGSRGIRGCGARLRSGGGRHSGCNGQPSAPPIRAAGEGSVRHPHVAVPLNANADLSSGRRASRSSVSSHDAGSFSSRWARSTRMTDTPSAVAAASTPTYWRISRGVFMPSSYRRFFFRATAFSSCVPAFSAA